MSTVTTVPVATPAKAPAVTSTTTSAHTTRKHWWSSLNRRRTDWAGQRVWLIGASSGIGAALAAELHAAGARVALSARDGARLAHVAASLSGHRDDAARALVLPFDATHADAWSVAHATVCRAWGGVDVVVFCAGTYTPMRAWEINDESMRRVIDVNLQSVYYGLRTTVPSFTVQGHGGIVLVASVAGLVGLPNASVYGPTKAALINLAELLYCDLRDQGIDVYLVNPGFVRTALTAKNTFAMPAMLTPEQAAQAMMQGMAKGVFSIHFPKRFTAWLYLLRHLPDRARLSLVRRFTTEHAAPKPAVKEGP